MWKALIDRESEDCVEDLSGKEKFRNPMFP